MLLDAFLLLLHFCATKGRHNRRTTWKDRQTHRRHEHLVHITLFQCPSGNDPNKCVTSDQVSCRAIQVPPRHILVSSAVDLPSTSPSSPPALPPFCCSWAKLFSLQRKTYHYVDTTSRASCRRTAKLSASSAITNLDTGRANGDPFKDFSFLSTFFAAVSVI